MNKLREIVIANYPLLAIVLLSTILKLFFLFHGDIVNRDGALYIAAAHSYTIGDYSAALAYYRMPFYPLLLAGVHYIVGDWSIAGKLLSALPLVGCLWPLYVISCRLFNDKTAMWTILLFAVLPVFNEASTEVMRDPMALLFVLATLASLLVFYQDGRMKWLVFAIAFSVVATLLRAEGILLIVLSIITGGAYLLFRRENCWQQRHLVFAGAALTVAFFSLVFIVYTNSNFGFTRLNEINVWLGELLSLKLFSGYNNLLELLHQTQQQTPNAHYHCNLLEVTRHYAPVIYLIGMTELVVRIVFPTSLLPLIYRRFLPTDDNKVQLHAGRWIIKYTWLLFVALNIVFVIKMNFVTKRYLWVPSILLLPWIGSSMQTIWQRRKLYPWLSTFILLTVLFLPFGKTVSALAKTEDSTLATAGMWLQNYDKQNKLSLIYNDRRFYVYIDRFNEKMRIYDDISTLKNAAQQDKSVDTVALYFSNKHPIPYSINNFAVLKSFCGKKKSVVFLQRKN